MLDLRSHATYSRRLQSSQVELPALRLTAYRIPIQLQNIPFAHVKNKQTNASKRHGAQVFPINDDAVADYIVLQTTEL